MLTIAGAFYFTWLDSRLAWNPSDYGGLSMINVPSNSLWAPSLNLINAASSDFIVKSKYSINANVLADGNVSLLIPKQLVSTCSLNFNQFPFDLQECTLLFANYGCVKKNEASVYFEVTQNGSTVALDLYSDTGEFHLMNATFLSSGLHSDRCAVSVCSPTLRILLHYKRKSSYYMLNLIIPACLLTSKYICTTSTNALNFPANNLGTSFFHLLGLNAPLDRAVSIPLKNINLHFFLLFVEFLPCK